MTDATTRLTILDIESTKAYKTAAIDLAGTILSIESLEAVATGARRFQESYMDLGLWRRAVRFCAIAEVFEARIARLIALGRS